MILQDSMRGTLYQYVKNKLNPVYLHEANKMKIFSVMRPLKIAVDLRNIMNFGEAPFAIHVLNTDEVVHSMRELLPIAIKYV